MAKTKSKRLLCLLLSLALVFAFVITPVYAEDDDGNAETIVEESTDEDAETSDDTQDVIAEENGDSKDAEDAEESDEDSNEEAEELSAVSDSASGDESGEDGSDDGIAVVDVDGTVETVVAKIGETGYASLSAAVAAVSTNSTEATTITMTADTTETSSITVGSGQNIVLDLNGKTVDMESHNLFVEGTLTIEDSTADEDEPTVDTESDYSVTYNSGKITSTVTTVYVRNGGTATLASGTVESTINVALAAEGDVTGEEDAEAIVSIVNVTGGYAVSQENTILVKGKGATANISGGVLVANDNAVVAGNGTHTTGKDYSGTSITIEGGTLIGHIETSGYVACGIYHPQDGTLTISGGIIYADGGCGILMRGGTLNMTGGTIIASGDSTTTGKVGDSRVVVSDSGIVYDYDSNYYDVDNVTVTLSDSVSVTAAASAIAVIDSSEDGNASANVTVSGGTYLTIDDDGNTVADESVSAYLADGLTLDESGSVVTDTTVYVAQIGDTKYATLGEAVAAVPVGTSADDLGAATTIKILTNIDNAEGVSIPSYVNLTIDFDGHTYILTGPGAGSSGTQTQGFQLLKDSTIVMKNGTIKIAEGANNIKRIIQSYANVTLTNMIFYSENQVGGEDYCLSFNNGEVHITGTTSIYSGDNDTSVAAFDVYYWASGYPNGTTVIFDDDYTGTIGGYILYDTTDSEKATLTIQGNGTFNGGVVLSSDSATAAATTDSQITIYGGTFGNDVDDYVADGTAAVVNADGTYTVKSGVAAVYDTDGNCVDVYETLKAAYAAAENNYTMMLVSDISEQQLGATSDKTVTLDLNGHTISRSSGSVIDCSNGTLYITDSSQTESSIGTGMVKGTGSNLALKMSGGTVSLESGTLMSATGYAVSISGGTLTVNGGAVIRGSNSTYIIRYSGGTITINDGLFTAVDRDSTATSSSSDGAIIYGADSSSETENTNTITTDAVNITGGVFQTYRPLLGSSITMEITGGYFLSNYSLNNYIPEGYGYLSSQDCTYLGVDYSGYYQVAHTNFTLTVVSSGNTTTTYYSTLIQAKDQAIAAYNEDSDATITITMNNDYETGKVPVEKAVVFTLDLNGYTLTSTDKGAFKIDDSKVDGSIKITIKDSSSEATGTITTVESPESSTTSGLLQVTSGTVYIIGGYFNQNAGQDLVAGSGTVEISGGYFTSDPSSYAAEDYCVVKASKTVDEVTYNYTVVSADDVASYAVAVVNGMYYDTLEDAFAAAESGDTVTLLANVTLSADIRIEDGQTITLDLGGFTLDCGSSYRLRLYHGDLTIKNGTITGSQPINVYGSYEDASNYSVLTVESTVSLSDVSYGICLFPAYIDNKTTYYGYGAVINMYGSITGSGAGIFVSGNLGNDTDSVSAMTSSGNVSVINVYGTIDMTNQGIAMNGYAIVNIYDWAKITGSEAIGVKRGVLNVSGGTLKATGDYVDPVTANYNGVENTGAAISVTSTYNYAGVIVVNVTGGEITSTNGNALYVGHSGSSDATTTYTVGVEISVTGGTFTTQSEDAEAIYVAEAVDGDDASYTQNIAAGGTYTVKVDPTYCESGYAVKNNGDGTYSVVDDGVVFNDEEVFMQGHDVVITSQSGKDDDTNLILTYKVDGYEYQVCYTSDTAARIFGGYLTPTGTTTNDSYKITLNSGTVGSLRGGSKGFTSLDNISFDSAEIIVNGGAADIIAAGWYYNQSANKFTVTVNGGTVGTIYGNGETSYVASQYIQSVIDTMVKTYSSEELAALAASDAYYFISVVTDESTGTTSYMYVPTVKEANITVTGGTVTYVYGGGKACTQNGSYTAYTSKDFSMVTDVANITISGDDAVVTYVNGGGFSGPEANWGETSGQDTVIVNTANITVSGGEIENLFAGGYNGQWKFTYKMNADGNVVFSNYNGSTEEEITAARNKVYNANVNINTGADIANLFMGGRSYSYVENSTLIVNDGEIDTLSMSGNYGYVANSTADVKGGKIAKLELLNRNYVKDITLNVTGGTVSAFYAGTGGAYKNGNCNEATYNISTMAILGDVTVNFAETAQPTAAYLTTGLERAGNVNINVQLELIAMDLSVSGYTGSETTSGNFKILSSTDDSTWTATIYVDGDDVSFDRNGHDETTLVILPVKLGVSSDDNTSVSAISTVGEGESVMYAQVSAANIVANYSTSAYPTTDLTFTDEEGNTHGYIFAGWYTLGEDGEYTAYEEFQSSEDAYAKFVDAELMNVICYVTNDNGTYYWRFITSLNDLNYEDGGFVAYCDDSETEAELIEQKFYTNSCKISNTTTKVEASSDGTTAGSTTSETNPQIYTSSFNSDAACLVTACYKDSAGTASKITVTPYWITADNTTVYGETYTFIYTYQVSE
ncbi:MAG: hypothetical protein LUG52_05440 [Clostridia bacterium]|nr:hypothetical protein [Clostridia bacterium]